MSNRSIAAAVALLASSAGCFASVEEHDAAATASASEALVASHPAANTKALAYPDAPMPLDHPVPIPAIRLRPQLPGARFAPEPPDEWERNPRIFGCYVRYAIVLEPSGKPVEVPITVCP